MIHLIFDTRSLGLAVVVHKIRSIFSMDERKQNSNTNAENRRIVSSITPLKCYFKMCNILQQSFFFIAYLVRLKKDYLLRITAK